MPSRYSKKKPFQRERKRLGRVIERVRKSKGMTQEDLAEKAHINVSYLAKIENGYINTTLRYLIKIARGLEVSVDKLIDF